MINKLYSSVKQFIKENIIFLLLVILLFFGFRIKVPYHIETYGNIIDISDKVIVSNGYDSIGSLNLTYVSEIEGNVLTYMVSKFNRNWDLIPNEKENIDPTKNKNVRNKLLLDNSLSNATFVAYNALNKELSIKKSNMYVAYVDYYANTNLEVGDIVNSVNGIKIESLDEYKEIVLNSNVGDLLKLVVNDGKEKYVEVKEYEKENNTYIYLICNNQYKDSEVSFNFKDSESGPSAGFMIALSIYDKLTPNDITKGYNIAGTGTIDTNGNVGDIDGVKYKLKGAVKNKADIFLVPSGNYQEAKKEQELNNYNIKIISINNFIEALRYLSEL